MSKRCGGSATSSRKAPSGWPPGQATAPGRTLVGVGPGEEARHEAGAGRSDRPRADRAVRRHAGRPHLQGLPAGRRIGRILPASMGDIPLDFGGDLAAGAFVGSHAVVIFSDKDSARTPRVNLMISSGTRAAASARPAGGHRKAVTRLSTEEGASRRGRAARPRRGDARLFDLRPGSGRAQSGETVAGSLP